MNYKELVELDGKRTQGEWHIGHINEDYKELMDIECGGVDIAEDVVDFNASFIASAPEAVRMLKVAVRALELIGGNGNYGKGVARKALNEIKGEER